MRAKTLIRTWLARDGRYAVRMAQRRPLPLSVDEQAVVRATRRLEALALPSEDDRELALGALARWTPPRMAQL